MLSKWIGAKPRKLSAVACIIFILCYSVFLFAKLHRESCRSQFWEGLCQNSDDDGSMNKLRRHISKVLLKAANDIKKGRKETAVSDLQMAAALLNHGQEFNRFIVMGNGADLQWPSKQDKPANSSAQYLYSWKSLMNSSRFIEGLNNSIVVINKNVLIEDSEGMTDENFSNFVTIIIDECDAGNQQELKEKMLQVHQLWADIFIVAGVSEDGISGDLDNIPNTLVTKVRCDQTRQVPLNILLQYVKTPFVLILKSLAAVTNDLKILKLLRAVTQINDVGIVGVSERGSDGGWNYACYQIFLENSRLTITEGYEYSQGACIFCDITSQTFLADTHILKSILPDSSLPVLARQIDWAIRLRKANVLTLTCPDVMVHTTREIMTHLNEDIKADEKCITNEDKRKATDQHLTVKRIYRKLAQKWELTTINLHNKTSLEYSCLEIHFNCHANIRVKHFMLPPCCLKLKHKMAKTLMTISQETLVPCKITAGTLLGAVKFKDAIPWDFDDDWYYLNESVNIFKENKFRLRQMGLSSTFSKLKSSTLPSVKHSYITMTGQGGFSIDLLGVNSLNSKVPDLQLSNMPGSLPCLQYGYYPVHIRQYLHDIDNITSQILKQRDVIKRQPVEQRELLVGNKRIFANTTTVQFPPLPEKKCYLLSFVKIGPNWVVGPWNPALDAKEIYGENLFKHRAHWRFEQSSGSWPVCKYPGHPMCLDKHPLDGSIHFQ